MDKGHLSFMYDICVYFVEKGVAFKTLIRHYMLKKLMKNYQTEVMEVTWWKETQMQSDFP